MTNQEVKKQDKLIDALFDEVKKPIRIWDLRWLSSRVNTNQGTLNAFHTFVESYFHEFSAAGKSYVVGDLVNDPRLFVFLRQQWDHDKENAKLDDVLADTLILFALEGTDPDKGIFKTRDEINMTIAKSISI